MTKSSETENERTKADSAAVVDDPGVYVQFSESTLRGESDVEQQSDRINPDSKTTNGKNRTTRVDDDNEGGPMTPETSLRQQWKAFLAMSIPYFRENPEGRCLFLGLIILMVLNSAVRVAFSYLARDFWSALGDKDVDQFYLIMKQFFIALILLAPVNVFYRFQRQRLAIKWRKWMTDRILHLYFYNSNQVYYSLERLSSSNSSSMVDNPDQRLSEDVRSFTQYSLSLFLTIAVSLIDLAAFSTILYTIEPNLFFSIIGFATMGTLVTVLIGRKLVRLNFERLQKEADFRFSLVRIRENVESIAFFRGEATEGKEVSRRFARVVSNAYDVIGTQRNLDFFTTSYNYLTWILPVVVIAPQYIAGNVELGVVQQAAAAFGHVLDDLSLIINEFEGLSEFSASIGRLHQFVKAVQDADPDRDETSPLLGHPPGSTGAGASAKDGLVKTSTELESEPTKTSPLSLSMTTMEYNEPTIQLCQLPPLTDSATITGTNDRRQHSPFALAIRNLSLNTPDYHRTLIHNLDLELKWGQRLLIIGPSGIGKSSLLRAIAGLWTSGSGVIERADTSDVYFLPQKPYCPLGTLRDQLLYPISTLTGDDHSEYENNISKNPTEMQSYPEIIVSDQRLLDVLKAVDLADLPARVADGNDLAGLDVIMDWGNTLSLGEQQRLAFARVLVHEPKLVIVDESTSAMDVSAEERMYGLIRNLTIVSVGHRPTLLGYHDVRLHLQKSGEQDYCDFSIDAIRSTPKAVSNEEVNLFFR